MQAEPLPNNLLSSVWPHLTKIQPVRGEGIYLFDAGGNRLIIVSDKISNYESN